MTRPEMAEFYMIGFGGLGLLWLLLMGVLL